MTKLTYESDGHTVTIETNRGDYTIDALFSELIVPLLRGIGYAEESIQDMLAE